MRVLSALIVFASVLFVAEQARGSSYFANRIEGQIFDERRVPIGDLYVELQNDVGGSLRTVRASTAGRFTFDGLSTGIFRVRVLSSGRNYIEQVQDVQFIPSVSGRNDDIKFLEFYLKVPPRRAQQRPTSPDVIFVQEVPDAAKRHYQSALVTLESNTAKGIEELEKAVAAFPTYFEALSRLGKEYALRKQYAKAYPMLLRAIDVNSRSFTAYYFLAFSFYRLNEIPAAIKAAEACTVILPSMAEGHTLLGTVLRIDGKHAEAEKALRKAISLSPDDPQARWQMALLLNRMNRNAEAADELEVFLKLAPHDNADKKAAEDLIARLRAHRRS